MKTILSSRKHRYLAKFSIFLITVALIAGMVGCGTPTGYDLTISISSTAGGISIIAGNNVTATANEEETVISLDEEKTISDLLEGTVVNLTAKAKEGYRFDKWTGNVDTIADVNAASTTITMNGRYSTIQYSITAEFVQGKEIQDWKDLYDIRENLIGSHILMKDLDSNTPGWEDLASPIANDKSGWLPFGSFSGTFDGQGHEIRDLFIMSDRPAVGLFSHVEDGGFVQDVRVTNANVTGEDYVGGLVGWNQGNVRDSYSSGSVSGEDYVGGLVGWNQGTVRSSNSTGSVIGKERVGGLVGDNNGTVSSSNFTGSVTDREHIRSASDVSYVGGLVGYNEVGSVTDSHSSGNVTGNYQYVGGLVGYNKCGTVENSYSNSNVIGRDEHVGGLVGWNEGTEKNEGTVEDSYSTGNVKGNDKVGGLVGFNNHDGRVSKSHSTGSVISEDGSDIGGLVGWNEGTVEKSHSIGEVIGKTNVGGLVGENVYIVERSYSTSKVTGKDSVGGLLGENRGTVSSSNSTGSVNGTTDVGGLVGHNEGTVESSYSMGSVTGEDYIGGLVGKNDDTVKESYSTGSVTGDYYVGGLVGENDDTVKESYSTGSVIGYSRFVGGLVGHNNYGGEDSVSDCYSTGSVAGDRYVGGLVGYNEQSDVINSYSIGTVNGTDDDGGLVGVNNGKEDDVRNCFWDKDRSGMEEISDGGTGKNTTEMMDIATFSDTATIGLEKSWIIIPVAPGKTNDDFIWNINIDKKHYPFLGWQSV